VSSQIVGPTRIIEFNRELFFAGAGGTGSRLYAVLLVPDRTTGAQVILAVIAWLGLRATQPFDQNQPSPR
jgi:hypothetical protein